MNNALGAWVAENVLDNVDAQQRETLEVLQQERDVILHALQGERALVLNVMTQLVDHAVERVDALVTTQALTLINHVQRQRLDTLRFIREERQALAGDVEGGAARVFDEAYRRLWWVLVAVWLGMASLLVLGRWLFVGEVRKKTAEP